MNETLRETMWAEVRRDEISGELEWLCSTEGDRGDGDNLAVVELAANTFPEGARLVISEPDEARRGEPSGFQPDDFAAALSPLLSGHEDVIKAGLSNNLNVIIAALRLAASPSPHGAAVREAADEAVGWLIELNHTTGPEWFELLPGCEHGWTKDSNKALRFARKEDAEAYINDVGWTEAVATEHMWLNPRPSMPLPIQPTEGTGWRPIETAPKGGTIVDLWVNGTRSPDCWYGSLADHPELGRGWCYGSRESVGEWMFSPFAEITHWMPLPASPEDKPGAGE